MIDRCLPCCRKRAQGRNMTDTIVYRASKIITMDESRPVATHVAVRDGRILAVGNEEVADNLNGSRIDDRFSASVIMPGFVEGHAHMMAGGMWRYCYIGYQDRIDPDGQPWPGLGNVDSIIAALRAAEANLPKKTPLIAWGFDPIFLSTERLNRSHLDAVSPTRPIAVIHSNFHLMTVNSAALTLAGYTRATQVEGVLRGSDGEPNGELQEFAAMFPVMRRLNINFGELARPPRSMRALSRMAIRVGVTTCADLLSDLLEEDIPILLDTAAQDDFPVRIVAALNGMSARPEEIAVRAATLRNRSTDRFRMGSVKIITDGSIQGFTARLKSPGYIGGQPNGIWNVPPDQLNRMVDVYHSAAVQMHIHVNGDEASEVALEAVHLAIQKHGACGHRHTLQHCQMASEEQFQRMAALGLSVNLFANHVWYFGDQHYDITMGPERASRIDACRFALDHGVPLAIHSDAPVTPMDPLFTAWCAINRLTPSGRILAEDQRIPVEDALRSITLGAAYTLGLDDEIGSITPGKIADFAVLGDDPTAVDPSVLKDVPLLGTVSSGRVFLS